MLERVVARYTDSENFVDIFVLSFLFTLLAVFLVLHVVPLQVGEQNLAGVMVTLLLSIAVAHPFVRYLIQGEEQELTRDWSERRLLHRHANELKLYLSFFFGATIAFAASRFMVPDSFYAVQCATLRLVGNQISRDCIVTFGQNTLIPGMGVTAAATTTSVDFYSILFNNIGVFISTFLLTFFFTSGIIFILAWNASVLGVWIGTLSYSAVNSILAIPFILIFYLPHGILEVAAYILAGVAGALLSRQSEHYLFNDDMEQHVTSRVLKDATLLVSLGLAALVLGAFIEIL